MSSSRRQSTKPIIVEVRPDHVPSIAPSTPPLPKAVRFASNASVVTGVTRPLSRDEAWSLFHFENHARRCASCSNPLAVYRRGDRLCEYGDGLAQDVALHVYHRDGQIYSVNSRDNGKPVSVEIPPEYDQLRSLLKAMDRSSTSTRGPPIIDYDHAYPTASRRERRASSSGSGSGSGDRRPEIILEPGNSASAARRKSVHRSTRYATVVVGDNVDRVKTAAPATSTNATTTTTTTTASSTKERRGTLYEKDRLGKKEAYRVEIREPDDRRERRRHDSRYFP